MKLNSLSVAMMACLLLVGARDAVGQSWPLPAANPKTDVPCVAAACDSSGQAGKKTVGYPDVLRFTGRWLDSANVSNRQYPFRTARAIKARIVPTRPGQTRLYAVIGGGALFAYDTDRFFSRVAAQERLMSVLDVPVTPRVQSFGTPEVFLSWDRWFYAEGLSGWLTEAGDGYQRLQDFDADDRGYVYVAYSAYSWGIIKDDGGSGGAFMPSVYQHTRSASDQQDPQRVISLKVKSGSKDLYYVLVCGKYSVTNIFDVTDLPNGTVPRKHRDIDHADVVSWAKSDDGTKLAIVSTDGSLEIYEVADLVAGKAPIRKFASASGNPFGGVSTDGIRFYTGGRDGAGNAAILTLSPETNYEPVSRSVAWPITGVPTVSYDDGYFALTARDPGMMYATDTRLYRATTLEDVRLDGYLAKYYTSQGSAAAGAQYAFPPDGMNNGLVLHKATVGGSAKLFMLHLGYSIGDVYELRTGGSISARMVSNGRPNQNRTESSVGQFYGDPLTFKSETSADVHSVSWSFGESPVPTVKLAAGNAEVVHQYGGVAKSELPKTYRVTASSALEPSISAGLDVTLKAPRAAVRIKNRADLLFLQPNASAPAQIVVGDEWLDVSDGSWDGHKSQWAFSDRGTETRNPEEAVSVGDCTATRTLVFTGLYGPTGSTLSYDINGITYSVRPYAALVLTPAEPTGGKLVFKADRRIGTGTLAEGVKSAVEYAWEITDRTGVNVVVPAETRRGIATLETIPDFDPSTAVFSGADEWRVRLTVKLTGQVLDSCATLRESVALSSPLIGPDPTTPVITGCGTVGANCAITVGSANNRDRSSWRYAWSVTGPAAVAGSTAAEFRPVFPQDGTYVVSVTVSNAVGSSTRTVNVPVDKALCSSNPTELNTTLTFRGATSGCGRGTRCTAGETIQFDISASGWNPSGCEKFTWDFGDGSATSSLPAPTHTYSSNGTYPVSLKLVGGQGAGITLTGQVIVGAAPDPGPQCGTMIPGLSVDFSYAGSNGCSPTGQACRPSETLNFSVYSYYPYALSCGTHTYQWNFGDNAGTSSAQNPSYSYATAGNRTVSLTITNPNGQSVTIQKTVTVGDAPSNCGSLSSATIGFSAQSGCTPGGGPCKTGETVSFTLNAPGYNFACGTHTYQWQFGDGGISTQANPTYSYATSGNRTVVLLVTNPSGQTTRLERAISVSSDVNDCPTMSVVNVGITYGGETSGMNCGVDGCTSTEKVSFGVAAANPYVLTCGTLTYQWDFGDGDTSTAATPSHTFHNAGEYTVKLKLSNGKQAIDLEQKVKVTGSGGDPGKAKTLRRRSSGRR